MIFSDGTKVLANNKQVNRNSCIGVGNGNEFKVKVCRPEHSYFE